MKDLGRLAIGRSFRERDLERWELRESVSLSFTCPMDYFSSMSGDRATVEIEDDDLVVIVNERLGTVVARTDRVSVAVRWARLVGMIEVAVQDLRTLKKGGTVGQ